MLFYLSKKNFPVVVANRRKDKDEKAQRRDENLVLLQRGRGKISKWANMNSATTVVTS